MLIIAQEKGVFKCVFLISPLKITCVVGISKAPWRDISYEYLQYMFLWRNEKNINTTWLKKSALR